MRLILDTNVFVSGVFFRGPPYEILEARRDGKVQLVVSPEILEEYQRVGRILAKQFPGVDLGPFIDLLTVEANLVLPPSLRNRYVPTLMMTSFLLVPQPARPSSLSVATNTYWKCLVIEPSRL